MYEMKMGSQKRRIAMEKSSTEKDIQPEKIWQGPLRRMRAGVLVTLERFLTD
jgi:hypothetical protein